MAGVSQSSGGVVVSYPVREQEQVITNAEYFMVKEHPNRVMAIKFIRNQYGHGLFEAMWIVDTIRGSVGS